MGVSGTRFFPRVWFSGTRFFPGVGISGIRSLQRVGMSGGGEHRTWDTVSKQAVRIILEYFLVVLCRNREYGSEFGSVQCEYVLYSTM